MAENPWIYWSEVRRILELSPGEARRLAGQLPVRRRIIPGARVKYHRADVERLAKESIRTPEAASA